MADKNDINTTHDEGDDKLAARAKSHNYHLRKLVKINYLEYASYVIKERAIPDVNDGLKPVQRRILWSLRRMDDGKFHKVANVVGHTMQFHPHGDASIYEALVNLANKEFFIEKQGNFGNIFTGDVASAARYIECRLSPLGREILFNDDITEFTESYDGRNKEPVFLPSKIPSLLALGSEGIAPGMTTRILSHNLKELLEAQIAILKDEPFEAFPDFPQGGIMDVSEYGDGQGKVAVRAKIDIVGRKLVIREVPPTQTTESLIASIERAANKNKIKVASINDYTTENVEIEIIPARGYNPEQALGALYAYTDCSVSVTSNILVINDNRPVMMSVSEVLRHNTDTLVDYLKRELEIELANLEAARHAKTLERIFIENRIYQRIEECETNNDVYQEVRDGLDAFKDEIPGEVTDEDIARLLAIPIRRISRFDINKNREEIQKLEDKIAETQKNLKRVKAFTIKYLKDLIARYGDLFPRRTEIESFDRVDKRLVALNNIKVYWDRENGYIGTQVKSDNVITCNEFDRLVLITREGKYKVVNIPDKEYVGKLYYFNKWDKDTMFSILYQDVNAGTYYAKRCSIDKFITDREYNMLPEGCRFERLTTAEGSVYECDLEKKSRQKVNVLTLDFSEIQPKGVTAKGIKFTSKNIIKTRFIGQAEKVNDEVEMNEDEPSVLEDVDSPKEEPPEPEEIKPEPEPEPEPLDEKLEASDIKSSSVAKKAKPENSSKTPSVKREKKAPEKDDDDESGNWGITQPEFGF